MINIMMSSPSSIANPEGNGNNRSGESKRKKRRKIETGDSLARPENIADPIRWRSGSEVRIYVTKLADALCKDRPTPSSPVSGGRAVRQTADRVLAVAAKGRTRWSRAILTGQLSLRRSQINKRHKHKKTKVTGDNRMKKPVVNKRLPPLLRKVKVLSRLVPGCRKVSFPNLLEEATDYIAALQMQVRAMTVLSELPVGGGGNGNGGSSQS